VFELNLPNVLTLFRIFGFRNLVQARQARRADSGAV
jgi:hypothetical protein